MTVVTELLEPAMDVIAVGHFEHFLLVNHTPESDCLADLAEEVAQHDPALAARMLHYIGRVASLNAEQTDTGREIAGAAERYAEQLDQRQTGSLRQAVRKLRAPLADLLNPMIVGEREHHALELVAEMIESTPERVLRSDSLAREMGGRRFRLLQRLLDDTAAVRTDVNV